MSRRPSQGPTRGMSRAASPPGHYRGLASCGRSRIAVSISGPTPEIVISTWKEHFGDFWYPSNKFYAPAAGIAPGEIAVIAGGKGPTKVTTGVRVIYADERSWSYMTPEGHPWAAIITFSAHETEAATEARIDLLVRANDPLYEASFRVYTSRLEDKIWNHTLTQLAGHFGSTEPVEMQASAHRQETSVEPVRQHLEELGDPDPAPPGPSLTVGATGEPGLIPPHMAVSTPGSGAEDVEQGAPCGAPCLVLLAVR